MNRKEFLGKCPKCGRRILAHNILKHSKKYKHWGEYDKGLRKKRTIYCIVGCGQIARYGFIHNKSKTIASAKYCYTHALLMAKDEGEPFKNYKMIKLGSE